MQVDPLKHGCTFQLREVYLYSGDLENARKITDRLVAIRGQPQLLHDALLLLLEGRAEAVIGWLEGWDSETAASHALLAMANFDLGNAEQHEAHMSALLALIEGPEAHSQAMHMAAGAYGYVGDLDAAFQWLDRMVDMDRTDAVQEVFHPLFWTLHDDPRWKAHRERLGMSEEQMARIEFTVPESWPGPSGILARSRRSAANSSAVLPPEWGPTDTSF